MYKTYLFAAVIACTSSIYAQDKKGFSGTITFRDGQIVQFEYLGEIGKIYRNLLIGKMGSQSVKYNIGELREIVYSDKKTGYTYDYPGPVVIVSKSGERFSINEVYHNFDRLSYVYNDKITKELRETSDYIQGKILSISVGTKSGNVKINPITNEYFPSIYIYDPFTGQKLEWADRK